MKRCAVIDQILRPLKDTPFHAYLSNAVQVADILEWILSQVGVAEVWQTSFSISEEFLRRLFFICRANKVSRINLVLDHKATNKTLKLLAFIPQVIERTYLADNHNKILLVRSKAGNKYASSPCSAAQAATSTVGAPTKCSSQLTKWPSKRLAAFGAKQRKNRKDSKTMERAATAYGKLNRVDLEDEQALPLDQILVQPFTATDDPSVIGIEPIPNINEKISAMIQKYRAETIDIEDVEFEEVDLAFDVLFPSNNEVINAPTDKRGNKKGYEQT